MYILGLTGGIAAGKSTVCGMFATLGIPVVDADRLVHALQGPGTPETAAIAARFGPESLLQDGSVNRQHLSQHIARHPEALTWLEDLLHPAVRHAEALALAGYARSHPLVVLDVPLLFETGAEALCDTVALCHCPPDIRKARAFTRPGMTEQKWQSLLARRVSEQDMLVKADHLIPTSGPLEATEQAVKTLADDLAKRAGHCWPALWQPYL